MIPANTDSRLGPDEWGIGAAAVVLTMPGNGVFGSLFSNVWDINASAGNDLNLFTWQYFVNYNMAGGWYLTSAPIMTANWEARSGQKWTLPVGGGAGRVFRIGKQPLKASAQYYYNLENPDQVGDGRLRLPLQFLFPK